MYTYFIPNARGIALLKLLWVVALVMLALLMVTPLFAQEVPPPAPAPELPALVDSLINAARDFVLGREVLVGFFVFLMTQVLKWIIPATVYKTETLYGFVVVALAMIYMIGQLVGIGDVIVRVADIGQVAANTILMILGMLGVSSVSYNVASKLGNPLAAGHQGRKWFSLVTPRYVPGQLVELKDSGAKG